MDEILMKEKNLMAAAGLTFSDSKAKMSVFCPRKGACQQPQPGVCADPLSRDQKKGKSFLYPIIISPLTCLPFSHPARTLLTSIRRLLESHH